MNVEIKATNDVLIVKCPNECRFEQFINDLNKLLDKPIFSQKGFYPRAFFDFKSRKLEQYEIRQLLELLNDKKSVLFEGISLPKEKNEISVVSQQLRNGQEVYVYEESLFLGKVNPGSYVYCYENVYFLNQVKGTIVLMNNDITVFGHYFEQAEIIVNHTAQRNLTTYSLVSVYYKEGQIVIKKENENEQNNCYNFG